MTTLLRALYTYTYENRMRYTREDELKYNKSRRIAEQAQKALSEMLSEEGQRRFEEYREEESIQQCLELETIFRAGISIGLELSRLQ